MADTLLPLVPNSVLRGAEAMRHDWVSRERTSVAVWPSTRRLRTGPCPPMTCACAPTRFTDLAGHEVMDAAWR